MKLRTGGLVLGVLLLRVHADAEPLDCASATTESEVQQAATAVQLAWAGGDALALTGAGESMYQALRCSGERISAATAVSVHTSQALLAFFDKDYGGSEEALKAVIRIQPKFQFPATIQAPEPLARQLDEARVGGAPLLVDVPGKVLLLVDGERASQRPAAIPFIAQRIQKDGAILATQYVGAGEQLGFVEEPLPSPAVTKTQPQPAPRLEPEPVMRMEGERKGGLGFGVDLGLGTGMRLEWRPNGKVVRDVGVRGEVNFVLSGSSIYPAGLGGIHVDWRLGKNWDLETTALAGVVSTFAAGGATVALQFDPPTPFRAQFGGGVAVGSSVYLVPDVNVGWTW